MIPISRYIIQFMLSSSLQSSVFQSIIIYQPTTTNHSAKQFYLLSFISYYSSLFSPLFLLTRYAKACCLLIDVNVNQYLLQMRSLICMNVKANLFFVKKSIAPLLYSSLSMGRRHKSIRVCSYSKLIQFTLHYNFYPHPWFARLDFSIFCKYRWNICFLSHTANCSL